MPPSSLLAGRRSLSEPGPLNAKGARGAGEIKGDCCPFARAGGAADAAPSSSSSSTSSSSSSSAGCPFAAAAARSATSPTTTATNNPWQSRLRKPTVDGDTARLTRRALRAQNRAFSLEEVARHRFADDGWIAVGGRVFDITEHVVRHKGWETGCGMTEVLSILAHLGSDCTSEFGEIHGCYPAAFAQLKAYDIGALAVDGVAQEQDVGP